MECISMTEWLKLMFNDGCLAKPPTHTFATTQNFHPHAAYNHFDYREIYTTMSSIVECLHRYTKTFLTPVVEDWLDGEK